MLRLTLIPVGRLKDRHLKALCQELVKRLRRYSRVEQVELADGRDHNIAKRRAQEGERILAAATKGGQAQLVALDRGGQSMSSEDLAGWLQAHALRGRSHFAFAIGGPDGLSPAVFERADTRLSLSAMTFTHEVARFILLEQLYRAMTIWRGEPYHR